MITMRLRGQLANQMFIIATAYAHSLRTNTNFAIPERSGKRDQFPMMFDHLPKMQQWQGEIFDVIPYREKRFGIYEPLPDDRNLHLMGYFQSFKYFEDYRKEVIELFNLPKLTYETGKYKDYVSIHVRRGDSLKFVNKLPQPTDKYFKEALEVFGDSYTFVVFSDDTPYCKEYFKRFDQYDFEFCEEMDAKKSMSLMASCNHSIITNSTFSLFASWLNDNCYKLVVSPHKESWFGEAYKDRLSAQDLVPDSYVQIKY